MGAWAVIRRRTRIIWRLAVAFTGLLGGMWLGDLLVPRRTVSLNDTRPAISRLAEPPGGPQTVLLLGLDQAELKAPAQGEVQLMLLARVYPEGGIELLQIPAELQVLLPGQQLKSLSTLYGMGGVALTTDVIAQLLGGDGDPLRPDRYLLVSLSSLEQAIDGLGGVPMLLREPIRYRDRAGGLSINLQPGQQWLNGLQTSQLLRYRGLEPEGRRRLRQEQLLMPVAQRLADPTVVPALPDVLQQLIQNSTSNLSQGEMLSLLAAALQKPERMRISRLPLRREGDALRLDRAEAAVVLQDWQQERTPGSDDTLVSVMGSDPSATTSAIATLQRGGQPVQEALQPLEAAIAATVIRYSNNREEALEVRRLLGVGELEQGPTPPAAAIVVLLGQDWSGAAP
jgi:anionic cell wall polymer biosynthesis LytR-Cps2A-Psr (LCP) family protein